MSASGVERRNESRSRRRAGVQTKSMAITWSRRVGISWILDRWTSADARLSAGGKSSGSAGNARLRTRRHQRGFELASACGHAAARTHAAQGSAPAQSGRGADGDRRIHPGRRVTQEAIDTAAAADDIRLLADATLSRLLVGTMPRMTSARGWRRSSARTGRFIPPLEDRHADAELAKAWRLVGFVHGSVCQWGKLAIVVERAINMPDALVGCGSRPAWRRPWRRRCATGRPPLPRPNAAGGDSRRNLRGSAGGGDSHFSTWRICVP